MTSPGWQLFVYQALRISRLFVEWHKIEPGDHYIALLWKQCHWERLQTVIDHIEAQLISKSIQ